MPQLDFKALFAKSFRVRDLESQREFDCIQMPVAFESPCPDKFELREVERVIEEKRVEWDTKTNGLKHRVEQKIVTDKAKIFDSDAGHYRGGTIRGKAGDYVLTDGETFFVVTNKDERGVPVFDKRFLKL